MGYKKITSFNIDEPNKKVELFLNNDTQPTIPSLDDVQFEVFSTVLNQHKSANRIFDTSNSQLNVSANLTSTYVTGYNLNFVPRENQNAFGIVLSDKNTTANSIPVSNYLVFLSVSEVLALMPKQYRADS